MKPVKKPDAGNQHIQSDDRGGETERQPAARATAHFLDSTELSPTGWSAGFAPVVMESPAHMNHVLFLFFLITELVPDNVRYAILIPLIITLLFRRRGKFDDFFRLSWPIVALLGVALLGTTLFPSPLYTVIKSIVYLSRPLVFMLFGYLIVLEVGDLRVIIRWIMVAGLVACTFYVFRYVSDPEVTHADRTYVRRTIGAGSFFMPLLLVFSIISLVDSTTMRIVSRTKSVALIILSTFTIFLSESRSNVLIVFTMLPMLIRQIPALLFLFCFIPFLLLFDITFTTPLLSSIISGHDFNSLVQSAPAFVNEVIAVDRSTIQDIQEFWRGFETYLAFSYVDAQGVLASMFGTGLGTEVPLPIEIKLGTEIQTSLPVFHNGLSLIYVRSGFVGIVLYAMQTIIFSINSVRLSRVPGIHRIFGFVAMGAVINICTTTPVVAGLFNYSGYIAMLMGIVGGLLRILHINSLIKAEKAML